MNCGFAIGGMNNEAHQNLLDDSMVDASEHRRLFPHRLQCRQVHLQNAVVCGNVGAERLGRAHLSASLRPGDFGRPAGEPAGPNPAPKHHMQIFSSHRWHMPRSASLPKARSGSPRSGAGQESICSNFAPTGLDFQKKICYNIKKTLL